jgi:hypothetical protein
MRRQIDMREASTRFLRKLAALIQKKNTFLYNILKR